MLIRLTKIVLVVSAGIFAALVVFNNVTDYESNYIFLQHVLSMDTTFPGNRRLWRAIHSPEIQREIFTLIIATEALVAGLCLAGATRLWRARNDAETFPAAKGLAVAGLTLGVVLWFGGFIAIGGEWFLMWQSKTWNGTQPSFRISAIMALILIYLTSKNDG